MSRFWTVALDSWKKQMKSISFWIMVLLPIIMMGASGAIAYFSQDSNVKDTYIVCDEKIGKYFEGIPGFKISDKAKAKKALEDKKIGSFAEIKEENGSLLADFHTKNINSQAIFAFNGALKEIQNALNIENSGLGPDKLEILQRKASFKLVEEGSESEIMYFAYFALVFYMYMMLIMYSNVIVVEIATEKGSKMIEFIFSSIRAGKYFAGKIFGNFLAILTHTALYGFVGIIAYFLAKAYGIQEKFNINLKSYLGEINIIMLVEIGVLVILSLLIFMIVAAMLGSLAQKQEDAGKVASPMMLVIIFAFALAMTFMNRDENILIKVLSYLPFLSVFFMPLRMIKASIGLGGGLIAILIMVVAIFVVYKLASKVYKKNILNYTSTSFMKKLFRRA